tara:strand:- start:482 stop:664 length:183 start_codon:yes stop_codon:yes gene_type:complete
MKNKLKPKRSDNFYEIFDFTLSSPIPKQGYTRWDFSKPNEFKLFNNNKWEIIKLKDKNEK